MTGRKARPARGDRAQCAQEDAQAGPVAGKAARAVDLDPGPCGGFEAGFEAQRHQDEDAAEPALEGGNAGAEARGGSPRNALGPEMGAIAAQHAGMQRGALAGEMAEEGRRERHGGQYTPSPAGADRICLSHSGPASPLEPATKPAPFGQDGSPHSHSMINRSSSALKDCRFLTSKNIDTATCTVNRNRWYNSRNLLDRFG